MKNNLLSLITLTLLGATAAGNVVAQEQAYLAATSHDIRSSFSDRFAVNSALHLARWYAYMGRPHPATTDKDWQGHLQLAAQEAMQCVNAALPRYVDEFGLKNSLPSVDANIAKTKVVNLIVQGLYGHARDTQSISTFERQMSAWTAPVESGVAKGNAEVACYQKRPLPHLQWLIDHAADPALSRQDAQALMAYPERLD